MEKKIFIYEFVTPSDPITFLASDDKIALYCALTLGNGRAGCHRCDENGNEFNIESLQMFNADIGGWVTKQFGDVDVFIAENFQAIAECYLSFAYGDIESRKTFDDACEAITDPQKLKAFKEKHEDRNRSSISQWVKQAWQWGRTDRK